MTSDAASSLLDVKDLRLQFGGVTALDGMSIHVNPREIVGIVGPNGAGKTALVNCITGFYAPMSGRVHFDGHDITSMSLHRRSRAGIARTFQNIRLFRRMTVLENVALSARDWIDRPLRSLLRRGGSATFRDQAMTLLAKFRLVEKADQLASSLAYGEARRLEIARAIATRPRLLILDEPAAGMNERESVELITDIRDNMEELGAVLVIEHDIAFIRALSHRVVVMENGRKLAEGTADSVFADPAVIEAYLGEEAADG
jgi:branched-chain amino acid transport system ATP-binding protein